MRSLSTIGYKSGLFAKQLLEKNPGLKVKNHFGSIMDWCHEGRDLVNENGEPTKDVHGAGKDWVKLFPQEKGYNFVL